MFAAASLAKPTGGSRRLLVAAWAQDQRPIKRGYLRNWGPCLFGPRPHYRTTITAWWWCR